MSVVHRVFAIKEFAFVLKDSKEQIVLKNHVPIIVMEGENVVGLLISSVCVTQDSKEKIAQLNIVWNNVI